MPAPPSTIPASSGAWIWTNQFGDYPASTFSITGTEIDYYRFMPDFGGSFTISVAGGTSLDSIIRLYDANGVALTNAIDNPTNGTATETITMNLTAGVWYIIGVGGFNGDTGNYNLSITGRRRSSTRSTRRDRITQAVLSAEIFPRRATSIGSGLSRQPAPIRSTCR